MTNEASAADLRKGDVVFNSRGQELTVKHDAVTRLDGKVLLYFVGYGQPVVTDADHAFATDRY